MSTCARDDFIRNAGILIVDDQEMNLQLLEAILRQAGHSTLECLSDPREAVSRVAGFAPDLILLDLMMPYVDGFTVLRQLEAEIPSARRPPVIVLTADLSPDARKRAL